MHLAKGTTKHSQEALPEEMGFIFILAITFSYWQCIDCQKLLKGLDLIISLLAHFISIAMATFSCLSSNAHFNQIFPHSFLCAPQQCNEIYGQAPIHLTALRRNGWLAMSPSWHLKCARIITPDTDTRSNLHKCYQAVWNSGDTSTAGDKYMCFKCISTPLIFRLFLYRSLFTRHPPSTYSAAQPYLLMAVPPVSARTLLKGWELESIITSQTISFVPFPPFPKKLFVWLLIPWLDTSQRMTWPLSTAWLRNQGQALKQK